MSKLTEFQFYASVVLMCLTTTIVDTNNLQITDAISTHNPLYGNLTAHLSAGSKVSIRYENYQLLPSATIHVQIRAKQFGASEYKLFVNRTIDLCNVTTKMLIKEPILKILYEATLLNAENHPFTKCPIPQVSKMLKY